MSKNKKSAWIIGEIVFLVAIVATIIIYVKYIQVDVPYADVNYSKNVCKKFTDLRLECEVEQQTSEVVPKGKIIVQEPKTATKAYAGDKITLIYSLGSSEYVVPNLNGKTLEEAKKSMKDMNVTIEEGAVLNNTVFPEGLIVSTVPKEGEPIRNGETVKANISSGKKDIPSLVGKNITEAEILLKDLGYEYEIVEAGSEQTVGTVLKQEPIGLAPIDSVIILTVAKTVSETKITVPNIIGKQLTDAEIMLAEAGFTTLKTQKSDTNATIVDAVNPAVGSEVDPNDIVTITLKVE